ncbi:MAG: thioredoxin [Myxococcota bacterium]
MATVEATKDNIEQLVGGNDIVLLDFWASWCGPCKTFGPIFEDASEKHPDIVFAKVNTEEQQELAGHFQVRSIPTIVAFKEQIGVFSQPGALPAQALEELIGKLRALDMDEVREEIDKSS